MDETTAERNRIISLYFNLISCALILASGCSSGGREGPPDYELSNPSVVQPGEQPVDPTKTPPFVTVLEPGKDQPIRAGDNFKCLVRVEVLPGGTPPSALVAELRQGAKPYGSNSLEVKKKQGNTYLLETKLKAPNRPGTYTIRIEALYSIHRTSREPGKMPELETKRIHAPGPSIKVES